MICDRSHFMSIPYAQNYWEKKHYSFFCLDDVVKLNLHRCELQTNECEKKKKLKRKRRKINKNNESIGLWAMCVGSGYLNATRRS